MSGLVIGVDVGGTKVAVAALGEATVLAPTDCDGTEELIAQIVRQVRAVADGREIAAVGIGIPSVIEFATGRVRSSVNIPLEDVPLREELTARLGAPVFVDNDATLAALAEAHDEAGQLDAPNLVMLTVGTGVGGGIVIGGRVYRGATGAAGELGHTLIAADPDAPPVGGFPKRGSLEALAAGHVLDELARDAAARHPESALGRIGATACGPDAVEAARDGDPVAIEILAVLGRRLGIGIANAINAFDPDVVAIGGGVSAAGELLLGPARAAAEGYVLPGVGTATEIRIARSGPAAGVRGAALLARTELTHHSGEAARV
jgi:glucokinase